MDVINLQIERRRKMFHWFIDGLIGSNSHITPDGKLVYVSLHGLTWKDYDSLTPDFVTEHYNVEI